MKIKALLASLSIISCFVSCSKNVEYTPEFIEQTSGRYLLSPDEVLEVYYDNDKLRLKWRGAEHVKPVIIDQNTFFVADMYKKLRFTEQPSTQKRYLSVIDPENETNITYDYIKLEENTDIPSVYLKNGNYDKALAGYLEIKKNDSTSVYLKENEFNGLGYRLLREKKYQNAIDVFKINVALYPESSNVYDSLAEAYARSGDSLQAFVNYTKSLEIDSGNPRAKRFMKVYNKKIDSTTHN